MCEILKVVIASSISEFGFASSTRLFKRHVLSELLLRDVISSFSAEPLLGTDRGPEVESCLIVRAVSIIYEVLITLLTLMRSPKVSTTR